MTETSLAELRPSPHAVIEMRAAVLREPGRPIVSERVLLEPPRRDEVLVRIAAAGVCHSDLHLADGLLGAGALADRARTRGRRRRRGDR